MLGLKKSDDFQPVAWVRNYPIHIATLLVVIHVGTMIGTTMVMSMSGGASLWHAIEGSFLRHLILSSEAVYRHFEFWQFLTYPFVNGPGIWFAVEMFLLFSFGREVEKFIGRSAFLVLYLTLLLVTPCLLIAWGLIHPIAYFGSTALHFAVFIAFATLYPNVDLLFTIKAKWVAWVLLAINSLQALAYNDWVSLLVLWVSSAAAWLFIERLRRGSEFSPIAFLRRKMFARKVAASPLRVVRHAPPEEGDAMEAIDPILDKIAKTGLGSLTSREREKLERARKALIEKS